ncbi:hypothetical protein [Leuconostoc falkenbergense]|uniref:hypothetical protein n=1 Tax=Leuconostoc falkenbergense TaxID=2766470 RepID=UPI00166C9E30|nr:hypothetical protein [Leuconostoc falkenbergense]
MTAKQVNNQEAAAQQASEVVKVDKLDKSQQELADGQARLTLYKTEYNKKRSTGLNFS